MLHQVVQAGFGPSHDDLEAVFGQPKKRIQSVQNLACVSDRHKDLRHGYLVVLRSVRFFQRWRVSMSRT